MTVREASVCLEIKKADVISFISSPLPCLLLLQHHGVLALSDSGSLRQLLHSPVHSYWWTGPPYGG